MVVEKMMLLYSWHPLNSVVTESMRKRNDEVLEYCPLHSLCVRLY